MIYAVVDTNVLVSALLTHNIDASTAKIVQALLKQIITPLYNEEILSEYSEVLKRPKFGFSKRTVNKYVNAIKKLGLQAERLHSSEHFPDPKDIVFYEVALSKEDAYLMTGNTKHFPQKPIVVTPAEMVEILAENGLLE